MTVIAWDGKRLAADRRSTSSGVPYTATKIFRANGCLLGFAGEAGLSLALLDWFTKGENPDDYPAAQREVDNNDMLVIRPDGTVQKYGRFAFPTTLQDAFVAIGCGRDFALAAMLLGKSAAEAVEVACVLDIHCGNGIDVLALE